MFGLDLQQIIDLDEKLQTLTTNMWLRLNWNDYNMRWNPEEYGNVTQIIIPPSHLWTPDLILHQSASTQFDPTFKTNIVVSDKTENREI